MTYYSVVTDGKKLIKFEEITKEMFDNATRKETIEWMKSTFDNAIETKTPYGHMSSTKDSNKAVHWVNSLEDTPAYIQKAIMDSL